jgi:hypothetical protein
MAANDYYNSTGTTHSSPTTHHNPYDRTDAPLPPVPGNNHSTQSISPVSSPFDDHNRYDYSSTHNLTQSQTHVPHSPTTTYGDTSYHGASPYNNHTHHDPFADQNAIPLQQHGKMNESPTRYQADPEGRYYPQGYGSEKKKKKGWLSGRVTWVVYILTAVQCGVFVGELIKNGMFTLDLHPHEHCFNPYNERVLMRSNRNTNKNPNRNKASVQYHDRSFALCAHKHGCPLPALHA